MPPSIHTVRNTTGAQLELWNGGTRLANLANNQSINTVPLAITSVSYNSVGFHNKNGAFVNGDSYLATHRAAARPNPEAIVFTGNSATVTFT